MHITEIEISRYRSIQEPVSIRFFDSLPTVLIGKNGSGKTNILEALERIASAQDGYGGGGQTPPDYRIHLELTPEELVRLCPGEQPETPCRITVLPDAQGRIAQLESAYLVPRLRSEIDAMRSTAKHLQAALSTYRQQLEQITYDPDALSSFHSFQLVSTNFDWLQQNVSGIIEEAERLADTLLQRCRAPEDRLDLLPIPLPPRLMPFLDRLLSGDTEMSFQLAYVPPHLAPFEAPYITIDEPALREEIDRINQETRRTCESIHRLLTRINDYTRRLLAALNADPTLLRSGDSPFYWLIHELQTCVSGKCSFLRNESTAVLFTNGETTPAAYRSDKSRIIWETYLQKVYDGDDKGALLRQIRGRQGLSLSEDARQAFEQYLNSSMPAFEQGMYDRISVEQTDEGAPVIRLQERSGESVALDATSAGRRWYFTYYFIKNTLQPGDWFLIDEPAALLHPSAQQEVQRELLALAESGVQVLYSTHSPYLIPHNWKTVQCVIMGETGTAVPPASTQEEYYKKAKEITGNDVFCLQALVEKYFRSDKDAVANRCYAAIREAKLSVLGAAEKLQLSESTIRSWGKHSGKSKKSRSPKFENILLVAALTGKDINELI